ncbi:MAG: 50S ribosomal protein L24 [Firmicutes bacterium]|nr:50S ribosomal protein L24 [Bacillota bacterium]
MANKVHVKKGDLVKVLKGKDAGKRGKVLEVIPSKNRVVVEGLNIIKKHTRATREMPQGGIIESPGPISASNVMLVCPACDVPTRPVAKRAEDGSKERVCRRCGKSID